MAYVGTTAATSLVNVPRLLSGGFINRAGTTGLLGTLTTAQNQQTAGGNLWFYQSTNTSTQTEASVFFSDGWKLGMRAGDVVMSVSYTSGSTHTLSFGVVADSSTSGVTISTGSRISSSYTG